MAPSAQQQQMAGNPTAEGRKDQHQGAQGMDEEGVAEVLLDREEHV